MKIYAIITAILFFTMLFVPLFSLLGSTESRIPVNGTFQQISNPRQETEKEEDDSQTIKVMLHSSETTEEMDMMNYIIGCVAAEMPAEYEKEALKAQAVASYTYALYMKQSNTSKDADISDDPSIHQAYLSEAQLKEKWGNNFDSYIEKISSAVKETYGEYLTYNSELIKPAYHALSAGKTNSGEDVWGNGIPYLVSVNSVADKLSPSFETQFEFNEKELIKLLGIKTKSISIGDTVTSSSGYVKKITVSQTEFTGEEIRSLLSLRSGNFTIQCDGDTFKFICYGYGHGVGMSQYGANEMAKQGSSYKEILKHYYKGVEVEE